MLNDAFLARLDALRLSMQHSARGGAGGARRSRSLGSSAEFSDFREYSPGDDVRRLDWNAYARFDRLFMKLFTEEQESAVTILVDGSGSMEAKAELTIKAAEALSYLTLSGGDRLRILWLEEKKHRASPWYGGRGAYPRADGFIGEGAFAGKTMLLDSIRSVEHFPKGMTFLVTDGYQEEGLRSVLELLRYRKQEIALIQPLSAFEMQPDLEGALRLKDAEGEKELELLADEAALRQYQQTLQTFLQDCRGQCQKQGVSYVLLDGRVPFEEAFLPAMAGASLI